MAILGFAAVRFKVEGNPIVDQIDSLLPQTQCGQCGYPGCRPYAEAISKEEIEFLHFPKDDVLFFKEDREHRNDSLKNQSRRGIGIFAHN